MRNVAPVRTLPKVRALARAWTAGSALGLALLLGGCGIFGSGGPAVGDGQPTARRHFNPVTGVESVAPSYPAESRRQGEQGRVSVRARVGPDGQATQVQVVQSSGFARLDAAALDCVRQWRFLPVAAFPAPAGTWRQVPLTFVLQD